MRGLGKDKLSMTKAKEVKSLINDIRFQLSNKNQTGLADCSREGCERQSVWGWTCIECLQKDLARITTPELAGQFIATQQKVDNLVEAILEAAGNKKNESHKG